MLGCLADRVACLALVATCLFTFVVACMRSLRCNPFPVACSCGKLQWWQTCSASTEHLRDGSEYCLYQQKIRDDIKATLERIERTVDRIRNTKFFPPFTFRPLVFPMIDPFGNVEAWFRRAFTFVKRVDWSCNVYDELMRKNQGMLSAARRLEGFWGRRAERDRGKNEWNLMKKAGDAAAGAAKSAGKFIGGAAKSAGKAVGGAAKTVGGWFSDERLKENVRYLHTTPEGVPWYSFNYIGDDARYEGTIAQRLPPHLRARAVTCDRETGFYRVDYDALGLSLKT